MAGIRRSASWLNPQAVQQGSPHKGATTDLARVLLKVSEDVRMRFSSDCLVIEDVKRGFHKSLPLSTLPLLGEFAGWTPLFHAFLPPGRDLALTLAVMRELVASGILVTFEEGSPRATSTETWAAWGTALPYHLESRTTADQIYLTAEESVLRLQRKAEGDPRPPIFKNYPDRPFYPLPNPGNGHDPKDFLDVLLRRRTCRAFSAAPVNIGQLSTLLYLSWGCTGVWSRQLDGLPLMLKTSPSGGSLHSVEVYPILLNVSGVPAGVYHYSVQHHGLEMVSQEDPREWLSRGCGDQEWVRDCGAVFVMTAVLERMGWKYTEPRAYRVLLFEIGHISQTFGLAAESLGLASFVTAALRDELLEHKLELDHLAEPIFLATGAGVPLGPPELSSDGARTAAVR